MNLLVLAYDYDYGGIAGYTHAAASGLAERGHTVWVAADRSRPCSVETGDEPYRRTSLRRRSPRDPRLWLSIPRLALWARRRGIDAVIAPVLFPGGIPALGLRRLCGLPYIVFAYGRELCVRSRRARLLAATIFKRASGVVAVSDYTKSELERLFPRAAPARVVHFGIDVERFRPAPDRETLKARHDCVGRRVLLSVSRLVRHKGHMQVLDAMPEIVRRFPDVLYVIAGGGPEETAIRESTARLGLGDHVRLLGRVPDEELPEWYALSDVFVLPTRDTHETESGERAVEGFCIVLVEANAAGRPVVAGRSGGTVEAVQDGVTGLLVDGSRVDEVRDAVIRLLADPALADRLGRQGRERVERELSGHTTAERFDAALAALISP